MPLMSNVSPHWAGVEYREALLPLPASAVTRSPCEKVEPELELCAGGSAFDQDRSKRAGLAWKAWQACTVPGQWRLAAPALHNRCSWLCLSGMQREVTNAVLHVVFVAGGSSSLAGRSAALLRAVACRQWRKSSHKPSPVRSRKPVPLAVRKARRRCSAGMVWILEPSNASAEPNPSPKCRRSRLSSGKAAMRVLLSKRCGLTLPSSGHVPAGFARFHMPLMSTLGAYVPRP
jgi:hypothetical protein